MKITVIIIIVIAGLFYWGKKESPNHEIYPHGVMTSKRSLPITHFLNSPQLNNKSEELTELENELKKYNDLNYDDLNQEQLNTYNKLVLQRAEILKKQIFSKAEQMGYHL